MARIGLAIVSAAAFFAAGQGASAQTCRPVADRTGEIGCWILTQQPMGQLTKPEVFWHLDVYPARAEAEAAKTATGTVVDALGKIWLLTLTDKGWETVEGRASRGNWPDPGVSRPELFGTVLGGSSQAWNGVAVALA